MAPKRTIFNWNSADWMNDPGVRAMSLAARGLWMDMLCLMDQSPRRGFFQHPNGQPVTAEQLARMTGCSTDEVSRILEELLSADVYSSTSSGVIYNRRMVRDENAHQILVEAGRKGGNPTLNPDDKPTGNPLIEPNAKPPPEPPKIGDIDSLITSQCLRIYEVYPRKVARGVALKSIRRALQKIKFDALLEAVQAFANARAGEDPQFTPYPASWFNAERWNDDRKQWKSARPSGNRVGAGQQYESGPTPAVGGF